MLDDPTLAATGGSGSIPQGEGGVVLRRGDSLDRFVIIDELGRGAMGTVYAAFDTKLERQVAVKLLHSANRGIGSLLAEAQALARINHPNVVTVHDVGEHEGRLFLAMELVRGKTLREYQRAPGQLWRDILEHYRQAARGLAAVHAADLVHGDFKPENVMVADDGRVLVMDFGIARSLRPQDSADGERPSSSGSRSIEVSRIRGTPAYMAPEQFSLDAVGPLSDQFSFCVALYEGLWGERPFDGTTLAELSRAVSTDARRPRPSKSSVPGWVEPIIDRGLSTHAEDRFESMLVLDDAFDASLRRRMKGFSLLGATGLTVVVGMAVALTPARTEQCDDAAAALREQLAGPELTALKKRVSSIDHPDAASVSGVFERQLDVFAAAWFEANTALCSGSGIGPELTTLRRNCLDRERDNLRAVSDAFSDTPDFDLARASNLASALPRPERCSELEDLNAPEGTGVEVLIDAQQRVAQARAMHQAGQPHEGVALVSQVLADLEGVDAPRLKANAHLWMAARSRFAREYDDALSHTRAAQAEAAYAGDDELQALSWLDRVYHTQSASPEADTLMDAQLEAAELALVRAGNPPELRIRLLMRRAGPLMNGSAPRDAVTAMDEALALAKTHPPRASVLSNIHNLRAIAFIRVGDTVRAQEDFQRAHDVLEDAYGSYHPTLSQSRSNLGAVCMELGDLECARSTLEKSLRSLEAASRPNLPSKATVLALLSNVAFWQDRFEDAEHLARASLATSDEGKLGDPAAIINAYQGLLRALIRKKDWEAGTATVEALLDWNKRIDGTERSAEAHVLASDFHRHRGDDEKALEAAQRARKIRVQHLESPHVTTASAWRLEADVLRDLERLDEAEAALTEAETIIGQLADAPQFPRAQVQLSRVRLLTATNHLPRATALALTVLRTFDDPQPLAVDLREDLVDWMREHNVPVPESPRALAPLSPG